MMAARRPEPSGPRGEPMSESARGQVVIAAFVGLLVWWLVVVPGVAWVLITARKQLEPFTAGLLTACRRRRCSAHLRVRLRSPPWQTARMLDGDRAPATCAP